MSGERLGHWSTPWAWAVPLAASASLLALLLLGGNRPLFLAINGTASANTGEWLWAHLTVVGDTTVLFALALLLFVRRPLLLWAFGLTALVTTLYVHGLKNLIEAARPAAVLAPEQVVVIGKTLRWQSFPSGHSAAVFAFAGLLCQRGDFGRGAKWALLAAASLVAASRIAVGAHWPVDVLAGAAGGWLSAVAAVAMAGRLTWGCGPACQRLLAALLAATTVWLVSGHDSGYPQARVFELLFGTAVLLIAAPRLYALFRADRPAGMEGEA